MMNEVLASKITTFFDDYDMLGGATRDEMYDATLRTLKSNNKDDIQTIIDYFKDIKWANKRAQNIYSDLISIIG